MKGKNIIFASIWLLLPNSRDCGQNIYSAAIKVIYPHKESRPFENGGNIKLGLLSFYLYLHSPLEHQVKVAKIQRNGFGFLTVEHPGMAAFYLRYIRARKITLLVSLLYQVMALPQNWHLNIRFLYKTSG